MANDENTQLKEWFRQAQELCAAGEYAKAWPILEELHKSLPDSRRLTLQRAQCLLGLVRYDDAENELNRLAGKVDQGVIQPLLDQLAKVRREAAVETSALGPGAPAPAVTPLASASPVSASGGSAA